MQCEEIDASEVHLVLDEVFDFKKVEEFRRCYEGVGPGYKTVAVNFLKTRYMDSSALGMLLNVQSHFKAREAQVRIINVSEPIRKILSISRFDQKFSIQ